MQTFEVAARHTESVDPPPPVEPARPAAVISLRGVAKSYGSIHALTDVTLDVAPGEFVYLVGQSGCGKSTLLRLLTREDTADVGDVHVAGNDLRVLDRRQVLELRRHLGSVFQDYKLLPTRTVFENVAFALRVMGMRREIPNRVAPMLDVVGLAGLHDRYPHQLSGGEQQRVCIARAFINKPAVLLADEPTANLDPDNTAGIMRLLEQLNRTGTTVVMATHDVGIVKEFRHRVIALDAGRVVADYRNEPAR